MLERPVAGCLNGARLAVEIGRRRPGLFGHAIALSVAGGWDAKAKPTPTGRRTVSEAIEKELGKGNSQRAS